ncbi:hypothetical protein MBT84_41690 [Streptomyces sp. MBT84]|nr:hypothetical protein [Streptomyces sp. MBT84]
MLLGSGQRQRLGVAALAAGAAAEESRAVAQYRDDDIGLTRHTDGLVDAGGVSVVDSRPVGHRHVRAGELALHGLAQGGQGDPVRDLGMVHADVQREGVAAQHGRRLLGVGADQRDAAGPVQRQCAVVGEQHHRPFGHLPGQVPVLGRVEVHRAAQCVRVVEVGAGEGGRHRAPVRVEESQPGLLGKHPVQGTVDDALRYPSGGHGLDERGAERLHGGQFDVDSGAQGGAGRLAPVAGDPVQCPQEGDAEVVGHDRAVESPDIAQQPGEQILVGRRGHAVGVVVGTHDGPGSALADRHLEGRKQDVGAFA